MALIGVILQLVMTLQRTLLQVVVAPMVSVTQVALPVGLVAVVTVVRQTTPPITQTSCSYQPMSMPSDGSMTFLQSSVCKTDMACYEKGQGPSQAQLNADKKFADLQKQLSTIMDNSGKMAAIQKMPKAVKAVTKISKVLEQPEMKAVLDTNFTVASFFKNRSRMLNYLVHTEKVLSQQLAEELFGATINISYFMSKGSILDPKTVVCNTTLLGRFIETQNTSVIPQLSKAMCGLNSSEVGLLVELIQQEFDFGKVIRVISDYVTFIGDFKISIALKDLALLVNKVGKFKSLNGIPPKTLQFLVTWMTTIFTDLADMFDKNPVIKEVQALTFAMKNLEPFITFFVGKNDSTWSVFLNSLSITSTLLTTVSDFVQKITSDTLTFGNIASNSKTITEFIRTMGADIAGAWASLMKNKLNTTNLTTFLSHVSAGQFKKAFCQNPRLDGIVSLSQGSSDQIKIQQLQSKLCRLNDIILTKELTSLFNLTHIQEVVATFTKNRRNIDWLKLLTSLENIPKGFEGISNQLTAVMTTASATLNSILNSSASLELTQLAMSLSIQTFSSIMTSSPQTALIANSMLKFLNNKMLYMKTNNASALDAFLPHPEIKKLAENILNALPDLISMSVTSGSEISRLSSSVAEPQFCVNKSLIDYVPLDYRNKSSLVTLSDYICKKFISSIPQIKSTLEMEYKGLINVFMTTNATINSTYLSKLTAEVVNEANKFQSLLTVWNSPYTWVPFTKVLSQQEKILAELNRGVQMLNLINGNSTNMRLIAQYFSELDYSMGSNPVWLTVRNQAIMQLAVTRIILNKMALLKNGTDFQQVLLPNSDVRNFMVSLVHAVPDIVELQGFLLTDTKLLEKISGHLSKGEMFCTNFNLISMLPEKFQSRRALIQLSQSLCQMFSQSAKIQQDLLIVYQPLIQLFTNFSVPKEVNWESHFTELMKINAEIESVIKSLKIDKLLGPAGMFLNETVQKTMQDKLSIVGKQFQSFLNQTTLIPTIVTNQIAGIEGLLVYVNSNMTMLLSGVKDQLLRQLAWIKFMDQLSTQIQGGKTIAGTLLPNSAVQSLLQATINALPDVTESVMLTGSDPMFQKQVAGLTQTIMKGGILCMNFTLLDIFLPKFQNRTAIKQLSQKTCEMMAVIPAVTTDLTKLYGPLIEASTAHQMKSNLTVSELINSVIYNQNHLQTSITAITMKANMTVLSPFNQLMDPKFTSKFLSVLDSAATSLNSTTLQSQIQSYLYSFNQLEAAVEKETWWIAFKNQMAIQTNILKAVSETMIQIKNGKSLASALLPNIHVQNLINAIVNAVPDILEAEVVVNKNTSLLTHQMTLLLSDGLPCLNYTILDLYPEPFNSRSMMIALNSTMCQVMVHVTNATQDLAAKYLPFIQAFTTGASTNTTLTLTQMMEEFFKYYAVVMNFGVINNTAALIQPFDKLMVPSVQQRILAAAFSYMPGANASIVEIMNKIQSNMLPLIFALDNVMKKNPIWESVVSPIKMQFEMQTRVLKFGTQMLEKIISGKNIVETLLPSADIQTLMTALMNAVPNIIEAQATLFKNSSYVDAFAVKLMKGATPCVNVSILELYPPAVRVKPAMMNLEAQICNVMSKLSVVSGNLMTTYQPLMSLLTIFSTNSTTPLSKTITEFNFYVSRMTNLSGSFGESQFQTAFMSLIPATLFQNLNASVTSLISQVVQTIFPDNKTLPGVTSSLEWFSTALTTVEAGLQNNTILASIRANMNLQVKIVKFITEKLTAMTTGGNSAIKVLLPNAELQALLNAVIAATPDLLTVQASISANSSASTELSRVLSTGGILCVNYTLLELFPSRYRGLTSLTNMQTAFCNLLRQKDKMVAEVMTTYQPLIQVFQSVMTDSSKVTASWSSLIHDYMTYQTRIQAISGHLSVNMTLLMSIIAPFQQFMDPTTMGKVIEEWKKIEQVFLQGVMKPDANNEPITNTLAEIYSILDVVMAENTEWLAVRQNMLLQSAVMEFLNKKLDSTKNGTTVLSAFLPGSDIQSLAETLVAALPDILAVQGFILNNTEYLPALIHQLTSAGLPCNNYTVISLFPLQLRSRPQVNLLSTRICQLFAKHETVLQELMMNYGSILTLFTTNSAATNSTKKPINWFNTLRQSSLFSNNVMRLVNITANPMIWRPFIDAMGNTALLTQLSKSGSMKIDVQQASNTAVISAFALLDSQLASHPQWQMLKAILNTTGEVMKLMSERITSLLATGGIDKAITKTLQLQQFINKAVDALPVIVKDLSLPHLGKIAENAMKFSHGMICINFTIVDVLALKTVDKTITDFSTAMCTLIPAFPVIQNEYMALMKLIPNLSQNTTMQQSTTLNINEILSSQMALQTSLQTIIANITSYLMPFSKLASPESMQNFMKLISSLNASSNPTELLPTIQTIINTLENSVPQKDVGTAMAFVNDIQKMILDTWKKFKDGNYDFTLLFNNTDVNRIFHVIDKYPKILQTIIETSADLVKNPSKGSLLSQKYTQICSPAVFEKIFTVPSGATHSEIRNLLCNLMAMNGNTLVNHLISVIPNMASIMQKITLLQQNITIPKSSLNVTKIFIDYNNLFAEVATSIVKIKPGFDPKLFNDTYLMSLLGPTILKFQQSVMSQSNASDTIQRYEAQLLPIILQIQNLSQEAKNSTNQLLTVVKLLTDIIAGGQSGLEKELNNTTDGRKMLSLINNMPHVVNILIRMVQGRPNSLNHLISEIIKLSSTNVTIAPDTIFKHMCTKINMSALLDLRAVDSGNRVQEFWNNACSIDWMKGIPPRIALLIQTFMPGYANPSLSSSQVSANLRTISSGLSQIVAAANGTMNEVTSWMKLLTLFQLNITNTATVPAISAVSNSILTMASSLSSATGGNNTNWQLAQLLLMYQVSLVKGALNFINGTNLSMTLHVGVNVVDQLINNTINILGSSKDSPAAALAKISSHIQPAMSSIMQLSNAISKGTATKALSNLKVEMSGMEILTAFQFGVGTSYKYLPYIGVPKNVLEITKLSTTEGLKLLKEIIMNSTMLQYPDKLVSRILSSVLQLAQNSSMLGSNSTMNLALLELTNSFLKSNLLSGSMTTPNLIKTVMGLAMNMSQYLDPTSKSAMDKALLYSFTLLQDVVARNGSVRLAPLIPVEIVDYVMKPSFMTEMDLFMKDPAKYASLMLHSNISETLCVHSRFEAFFTNAKLMNTSIDILCKASINNGLVMPVVMKQYKVDYLMKLMNTNMNSTLLKKMSDAMMNVVSGLSNFDISKLNTMVNLPKLLQSMLMTPSASNSSVQSSMAYIQPFCPMMMSVMGQMLDMNQAMNTIVVLGDITADMVPMMKEMPDIVCQVSAMNFSGAITYVSKYLDIKKYEQMFNSTKSPNCDGIIKSITTMSTQLPEIQKLMTNSWPRMETCLKAMPSAMSHMAKGLSDVNALLKNASIFTSLSPEIQNIIGTFLSSVSSPINSNVLMNLTQLFQGSSENNAIISTIANVAKKPIETISKMVLSINVEALSNLSKEAFREAACNATVLTEYIKHPVSEVIPVSSIASVLCNQTSATLDKIHSGLIITQLSTSLSSQSALNMDTVTQILNSSLAIYSEFEKFFRLFDAFKISSLADIPKLFAQLEDQLRKLLKQSPLDEMVKQARATLDLIQSLDKNSTMLATIIDDFRTVLAGIKSFKTLQIFLPVKFTIQQFFDDATKIKEFVIQNTNLSSSVVDTIMQSKLSSLEILKLANAIDLPGIVCNKSRLAEVLNFNTTKMRSTTVQEISSALCKLNHSANLENFLETLIKNASISKYIQSTVSSKINEIVKSEVGSLNDLQNIMSNMQDMMGTITSLPTLDTNIIDAVQTGKQSTMASYTSALCGKSSSSGGTTGNAGNATAKSGRRRKRSVVNQPQTEFCKNLLNSISSSSDLTGKIMIKVMRPLLDGHILVTPDTPAVRLLATKANATFAQFESLKTLGQSMTDSLNALGTNASSISALKNALSNPLISNIMSSALGSSGNLTSSLSSLQSLMGGSTSNSMKFYGGMLANFTSCMSVNRFHFYPSENDASYKQMVKEEHKRNVLAAINFHDIVEKNSTTLPKHVKYTIRMPSFISSDTNLLFDEPFPKEVTKFLDLKYMQGFQQIQEMIEKGIISMLSGKNASELPTVKLQQFPLQCGNKESFLDLIGKHVVPIMLLVSFLCPFLMEAAEAVTDRENNLEKILHLMGRKNIVHWSIWFIKATLDFLILNIIMTLCLHFGKILSLVDAGVIFITLLDFSFALTMFGYFLSVFFNKSSLVILLGLMLYFVSYIPYTLAQSRYVHLPRIFFDFMMILPTMPLSFTTHYWTEYQKAGVNFGWSSTSDSDFMYTPFWLLLIQLFQGIGYFLLGWYFHNILGGRRGVSQPFYFFLTPKYWGFDNDGRKAHPQMSNLYDKAQDTLGTTSSNSSSQNEISISLRNLTKKYGKKTVVDNLSLDIRRNEVTVLLGPNGAGKSSTMSMLNGLISPTSGSITIEGYDRVKNFNTLRSIVGICTQHESFIPNMSVKSNLNYFASLRGLSSSKERKYEVERLIDNVGLRHFENVTASHLSGGKQRCLSLAIAFIGKSSVIILDEPTSGVDPSTRRIIWDLISSRKIDRTIIICTHHMDEAEIVGDQIAILRQGKLVAHDTPSALREKFGCQYLVSLNFENEIEEATKEDVIESSKKFVDSVNVETRNDHETNLSIKLTQATRSALPSLLKHLEASMDQGILKSIGLTFLALETVFTRVISGSEQTSDHQAMERNEDVADVPLQLTGINNKKRSAGIFTKMISVFYKQSRHVFRNWITYIITIFIPCAIIASTMAATFIIPKVFTYKSLVLTPSIYGPNARSFMKMPINKTATDNYIKDSMLKYPGVGTLCMPDTNVNLRFTKHCNMENKSWPVQPAMSHLQEKAYRDAAACSCDTASSKLKCPSIYSKGWPTVVSETMPSDKIIVLNDHQKSVSDFLVAEGNGKTSAGDQLWGGWEFDSSANSVNLWYNTKGFHTSPSYYNALSNMLLRNAIHEKTNNQTAAAEYGITAYAHPFVESQVGLSNTRLLAKMIDISIALVIMVSATTIPVTLMLRAAKERMSREKFMQHLYGISPLLYWISNFLWDMLFSGLVIGFFALIIFAFKVPSFYAKQNFSATIVLLVLHCFATLPLSYLFSRLFKSRGTALLVIYLIQILTAFIISILLLLLALVSKGKLDPQVRIMEFVFMIFPAYATCLGLTRLSENQVYSSLVEPLGIFIYKNPYSFEMLGYNFIYLAIEGVLIFIINILVETKTFKRAINRIYCKRTCCKRSDRSIKYTSREGDISQEDQTVHDEKERMRSCERNFPLAISHLSKSYRTQSGKVKAVSDVSFGVEKGQCFGLLGKNGAGKTSLFKCITGELYHSRGDTRILGQNYGLDIHHLRGRVGYCPQNDPLDDMLKVEETLIFYGRLAGVPDPERTQRINQLMHALDIFKHRHMKVKNLSGGNRRKLSVAIALVGDPEVLLLDEPSSGVDVVSKKLIWRLLAAVQPHTAILLTSHSMEEMQMVSNRLAVIVNGKLRAIGTCPELKINFGSTYTIQLWSTPISAETIQSQLNLQLPGCQLKCRKANVSEFTVPVHSISLAQVLEYLENLKQSAIGIREYAVQHTTLEQVFLQLSEVQSDGMRGSEIASSYDYGTYRSSSNESTDYSGIHINKAYINHDDDCEKL